VLLELDPVAATELEPVLSVDELKLLELGGVEARSAYVPLVPCAVLAVELVVPLVSVFDVGLVEEEEPSCEELLWPKALPVVDAVESVAD